MENIKIIHLSQYAVGLMTCQTLLLQYLIKKNIVNKMEFSNALDFLIDDFNRKNPEQAITLSLQNIREGLEKDLPDFPSPPLKDQRPKAQHPSWFRGIIEGGKK